ncbi:MAG: hypothetical protein IPN90_07905 [Elusimicrobia bacterium]|nr:hypothetical protein [Elusimicrobiota bacterium]
MDFSAFRSFHDPKAVQDAADYLLRKNQITGPVHTAFTGPIDFPTVVGVDDEIQYHANVNAYTQSASRMKEYSEAIARSRHALLTKKAQVFNKALFDFDRTVESYREGHSNLGGYAKAISIVMTNPKSFPSLSAFHQALRMEEGLDFRQVEAERAELIGRLAKVLKPFQLSGLLGKSMAYRVGQLRYGEFYAYLRDLIAQSGVSLKNFPAMDGYIQYVLTSDNINADALFKEMNQMEKIAYDKLSKTPEEKRLVAESHLQLLTRKLVDFSLTTEEWKDYEASTERGSTNDFDLTSFELFYLNAIARDKSMATNLLHQMEMASHGSETQCRTGVLVTGGFHSEGVTVQLKNAGVAVVSFVPKISRVDTNGGESLSIFTQEKTPLEKLFSGQKLFLGINQTEANVHIQKQMALLVALSSPNLDTVPGKVKVEWDHSIHKAKVSVGRESYFAELKRDISGQITDLFISPTLNARTIDYLQTIGKPILIGICLYLGLLFYPNLVSSGIVAGLFVGGMSVTNHPSHIKFFGEDDPLDPAHDGEKAFRLGVLSQMGVNIPPGFALLPSFYINDFIRTKSLSTGWEKILGSLKHLEQTTGQVFGNEQNPLFLSIRSNAGEEESMPGLMKTIVSVGLNQNTFRGLVERDGKRFALDTLRRFIRSYATGVFDIPDEEFYLASTDLLLKYGVRGEGELPPAGLSFLVGKYREIVSAHGRTIPEDVNEQLKESLKAVLISFDSDGARIFKKVRGLANSGMGAIVQKMVFGNLNERSASGVVFTRNRRTGKNELDGQYGTRIQGDDVVSGRNTPGLKDVDMLRTEMPGVYESLLSLKNLVENRFGWPQDLEITIQNGELLVLQTRDAEMSPEALLRGGEEMVEEKIISTDVFMVKKAVAMGRVKMLYHLRKGIEGKKVMKGKYGTPGAARGRMMFSDNFNPSSSSGDPVVIVEVNPNAPPF